MERSWVPFTYFPSSFSITTRIQSTDLVQISLIFKKIYVHTQIWLVLYNTTTDEGSDIHHRIMIQNSSISTKIPPDALYNHILMSP